MRDYSYEHAVRSLLTCDRCSYSVPTLVIDRHRGRLVSGYGVLQQHQEGCRGRKDGCRPPSPALGGQAARPSPRGGDGRPPQPVLPLLGLL